VIFLILGKGKNNFEGDLEVGFSKEEIVEEEEINV